MWSNSCCSAERRRLWLACLAALALPPRAWCAGQPEQTEGWRALLPQARILGEGDLRWFGLRIYHAALWSAVRPFDPAQPFALQLRYYRRISRARLVATSMEEIRRLSAAPIDSATLARWEARLQASLTDVDEGDELTGVFEPGHGMRLYHGARLLGDIADPALARAFFGIWLHPDSRDTALRRRLLGAAP
ncbi:chalcone isomerase family protein [Duganella callida]|uniref:Chalcone isomerase domain-containing protein n=1 Tax=Duganella callida TaxID=2561932 RepID=A0A4Y9SNQ9_9BURK|nr:chalcone isomerase family protein [Duganella callida]TFW28372.1 hypothetical protein E4L98_05735 [Duganella callida]